MRWGARLGSGSCDRVTHSERKQPIAKEDEPRMNTNRHEYRWASLAATTLWDEAHPGARASRPRSRVGLLPSLLLLEGARAGLQGRSPCRWARTVTLGGPSWITLFRLFQINRELPAVSRGGWDGSMGRRRSPSRMPLFQTAGESDRVETWPNCRNCGGAGLQNPRAAPGRSVHDLASHGALPGISPQERIHDQRSPP